jgi:leucyl-tRNA synthetase
MARAYDFKGLEAKWQRVWEERKTFRVIEDPAKPKYYCLEMYPYPSGQIHMGHVRNYSIGDVVARYFWMRGYNVLHPMGWDSFGLPAENAAIEHGVHPAVWTYDNIAYMRTQLKQMGFSYDWDREITSSDPEYYRWNQWLFLKMYDKGIAYKKPAFVNWCELCQTVLANEQAEGGRCWRHETQVIQKELDQWFFKITAFAEELLKGLDRLAGWPERVKTMQRNWIGKSEGAEVDFPLADGSPPITIFTTRQDTLYGATFMVLAPEHPLALQLGQGRPEVQTFVQRMRTEDRVVRTAPETEKEGVFTGTYAVNPLTKEKIPIWVANFVLLEYGTGAVMAVPAHDQRDFEFAQKYDLPIRVVIQSEEAALTAKDLEAAYEGEGAMVNSGPFSGMPSGEGRQAVVRFLEEKGNGKRAVNYRLRDWGISRQRYWGTPIPIIYCDRCGIVPVPYSDLPVLLPHDVEITLTGGSPLARAEGFVNVPCPTCQGVARRETDTMDTFVDSSWYFLRFCNPQTREQAMEQSKVAYWMPVDQYIGGIEHAVLHLLYARFFTKVIRDLGLISHDEPFENLLTQGMVCKETCRCPNHGYRFPQEVDAQGHCIECGQAVEVGRTEKMSKSRRNVVDPDDLLHRYGADTARLFSLFAAPPEKDLEWSDKGVEGAFRFLNRVYRLVDGWAEELRHPAPSIAFADLTVGRALYQKAHLTIKKVTEDIDRDFHFNTAIAALMELLNMLGQFELSGDPEGQAERRAVARFAVERLLILLAPFAPHLAEELWERLGHRRSIFEEPWPVYDGDVVQREELLVVVQVNGKLRSRISLPAHAQEEDLRAAALQDSRVQTWLEGKKIRRVVVVPKKLVNIVTDG